MSDDEDGVYEALKGRRNTGVNEALQKRRHSRRLLKKQLGKCRIENRMLKMRLDKYEKWEESDNEDIQY